ncbi:MAG: leucine-rich repeat protein [Candidatus Coproplasma sp.]
MKKKLLVVLSAIISTLALTLGLAACGQEQHEHSFSEWEIVDQATCEGTGTRQRVCKDCGYLDIEVFAALGHRWGETEWEWNGDEATVAFVCSVDYARSEIFTATVTSEITTESTCTAFGETTYTATVTFEGNTYTDTKTERISMVEHTFGDDDICTKCGQHKPTEGLSYELSEDGESYYCAGIGTSTDTEIYIASYYNGLPVTQINRAGFSSCESITSVTIPDSVISIGAYAFDNCASLVSATIGSGVAEIDEGAFSRCYELKDVHIKDIASWCGITFGIKGNPLEHYAKNLYLNNELLTDLVIPDGVTSIGDYAFVNYDLLTSVDIPDSITSIGDCAFNGCSLITELVIPDSVTEIGEFAFVGWTSLETVTIGKGVTSIGDQAFGGCTSLTSVRISDLAAWCGITFNVANFNTANPLSYAKLLVLNDRIVTELVIPDGVTSIGDYAFVNCSSITSVVIPDGVTKIGDYAFDGCNKLASVTIGNGVTSVGADAFRNCPSLKSATIPAAMISCLYFPETLVINGDIPDDVLRNNTTLKNLFVGTSKATTIGYQSFMKCSALESVTIGGFVTSMDERAFEECDNLKEVTIENGVTSIGAGAFEYCSLLTDVTIAESVATIGENVFSCCSALTSITIPDSVEIIGDGAFSSCSALSDVKIGSGVTTIGMDSFAGCSVLSSITIPDSVKTIGNEAFYNCKALTDVKIGNGVNTISGSAFKYCIKIASIVIPDSVERIGEEAFYNCNALEYITIGKGLKTIEGEFAFYDCFKIISVLISDLKSWLTVECEGKSNPMYYADHLYLNNDAISVLEIPDGVTKINSYALKNFTDAGSVVIPDSVKVIGSYAFYGCSGIRNITLGSGLTNINNDAFYRCNHIENIYVKNFESWNNISGLYNLTSHNCSVFINGEKVEGEFTIPDGTVSVAGGLFSGTSGLTSVIIPDSVTSIGQYAFYNCSDLASVTLGDGIESIGEYAFNGTACYDDSNNWDGDVIYIGKYLIKSNFTNGDYTIKEGTLVIADSAFSGCGGLTSVDIPDSVISIGKYAFSGCGGLTSITIGGGVESIGEHAFYYCSNLESVVISDSVKNISSGAFSGCSKLASITIDNGVESIGRAAFYSCSGLTSVDIPDSVISIGEYAFYGCSNLTSITIGDGVESIGECAFEDTAYYKNLNNWEDNVLYIGKHLIIANSISGDYTIKEGTLSIADSAFYGRWNMTSIVIPDSVTSIGKKAFYGCWNITSIVIPDSVKFIGESAFPINKDVTFANTNGWVVSEDSSFSNCISISSDDLANPSTVKTYLFDTYYLYYWKRS